MPKSISNLFYRSAKTKLGKSENIHLWKLLSKVNTNWSKSSAKNPKTFQELKI